MADALTQMGLSAPPMAAAPGAELGMGVPHMAPQQLHHDHNGPQEQQPHEHQQQEGLQQELQQPTVGAEDAVKLFGFITSEFRGFLAHVEQAVQVRVRMTSRELWSCALQTEWQLCAARCDMFSSPARVVTVV